MVSNKHPLIAREGWGFIGAGLVLSGIGWYGFGIAVGVPFLLFTAALLFLFRDPERKIPAAPLGVVCPVDGKVTAITRERDPCLGRDAIRIGIQMRPMGVYSVRCPIEGKIMKQGMLAPDATSGNRYAIWAKTDEDDDVMWAVERSGMRRIHYYVQPGERIGQGQRCGFVFRGHSLDVYVPMDSKVAVNEGQAVIAGESVISTLVHRRAVTINGFDGRLAAG